MLRLVSDDVPSLEEFMAKYKVCGIFVSNPPFSGRYHYPVLLQMDHPAALHRLRVGVPATVEHASEQGGGTETAQAVAETTQVSPNIYFCCFQ